MIRYIYFFLLFFLSTTLLAQLQRDSVTNIIDLSGIISLQLGDLDGDGDLDLMVSLRGYNGNFKYYENISNPDHFAPGVVFGERDWEDLPSPIHNFNLGDMDNDGDLDLVSGNILKASLPYRMNDGNAQFTYDPDIYEFYYDGQRDYHRQALEDIDNDGDLDILMFKTGAFELHINENFGVGNDFELTEPIEFEDQIAQSFRGWTTFDFDLDGDLDLACVVQTNGLEFKQYQLIIFEQTCPLCFEEINRYEIEGVFGFFGNATIEAANLDGDNFPELILNYQTYYQPNIEEVDTRDNLRILRNDSGNGQFVDVFHELDYSAFSTADLDADGDVDMVIAYDTDEDGSSGVDDAYYQLINEGDFAFTSTLIDEIHTGEVLHLLDLNEDGLHDLLTLDRNGNIIVRWRSETGSFLAPRSQNTVSERSSVFAPVDWDQDGDVDIISMGKTLRDGVHKNGIFLSENIDGAGNYGPLDFLKGFTNWFSIGDAIMSDVNGDNLPDVFIIEIENTDNGQFKQLKAYLSDGNGGFQDGITVAPLNGLYVDDFDIGDFDLDGDMDLVFLDRVEDRVWITWNNISDGNGFSSEPTNLDYSNGLINNAQLKVVDINGDLRPDLFMYIQGVPYWAIKLEEGAQFDEIRQMNLPEGFIFYPYQIHTDVDTDPAAELMFHGRIGQGFIHYFRSDFDVEADSFSMPMIVQYGISNVVYSNVLFDSNGDGLMDVVNQKGFSLNIPDSKYFTTPYAPAPFESGLLTDLFFNGQLADLDGDQENEIVAGFWSLNYYENDFLEGRNLQGYIRWDEAAECQSHDLLPGLEGWGLAIEHEEQNQLARTLFNGHYASYLPFEGQYILRPILPSGYWASCPTDSLIVIEDGADPEEINFSAEALVDCPLVVIDLSSTSISQCFSSSVSISYYNAGTAIAEDVTIEFTFDSRLLPVSSNMDWDIQTDTSLIFSFEQLAVGERGFISIQLEPDCSALILDEQLCFNAQVSPAELCGDMLLAWSGANLEVNPLCDEENTAFRIVNTGESAMDMAESYRISIVNDDIILYLTDVVILDPNQADTIWLPNLEEGYWHLAIDQPQGHPFPEPLSVVANSCATDDAIPNNLPSGDGDPFAEELCLPVLGPFDPNDKSATPIGLGLEHEIEKDWELNYTIQFQNVGNDRARTVTLQDQLSEWLDLSTFRPLAASHEYEWAMLDQRQLIVTFPDINLPDSTANEIESHGFFSFTISAKANIPVETIINNYADIYFDLNPPIRTGVVSHKIRKPVHATAVHDQLCAGDSYQGINIWQDTVIHETEYFMDYDSITFHHLEVLESPSIVEEITFNETFYWEDIQIINDTLIERTFTNELGCDSTMVYQFTLINSIQEVHLNNYSLTPNPSRSFTVLNSQAHSANILSLELRTMDGQLLRAWQPIQDVSGGIKINTNELPAGTYLLNILEEDRKYVVPLVRAR